MKKQKSASKSSWISGQTSTLYAIVSAAFLLFFVFIPQCTSCKHPIYYFMDDPSDLSNPMYHEGPSVEEMMRGK